MESNLFKPESEKLFSLTRPAAAMTITAYLYHFQYFIDHHFFSTIKTFFHYITAVRCALNLKWFIFYASEFQVEIFALIIYACSCYVCTHIVRMYSTSIYAYHTIFPIIKTFNFWTLITKFQLDGKCAFLIRYCHSLSLLSNGIMEYMINAII